MACCVFFPEDPKMNLFSSLPGPHFTGQARFVRGLLRLRRRVQARHLDSRLRPASLARRTLLHQPRLPPEAAEVKADGLRWESSSELNISRVAQHQTWSTDVQFDSFTRDCAAIVISSTFWTKQIAYCRPT